MVDYTDPSAPFVRSMYLTQIARIDEEGTTVEKRKQTSKAGKNPRFFCAVADGAPEICSCITTIL